MELQEKDKIVELVIVTSVAFTFLCGIIVLLSYRYQKRLHANELELLHLKRENQRALFAAMRVAEEQERQRIANNLHDDVGMNLNLIKQNLGQQKKLLSHQADAERLNADSLELLTAAIDKISTSVFDLVPKFLIDFGLISALKSDLEKIERVSAIRTQLDWPVNFQFENAFDLGAIVEINRICAELLNNTIKHTACSSLKMGIVDYAQVVEISLHHNGKAISTAEFESLAKATERTGLKSIKARCFLLNAELVFSGESGAAQVKVILPKSRPLV